jgi:uncharacterized membrane protein
MVLVPITVTAAVIIYSGRYAESLLGPQVKQLVTEKHYRTGMGIGVGILVVFLMGVLMNLWLFRRLFRLMEKLFDRIPLIKTLYGSVRDMLGLFSGSESAGMSQVVLVTIQGMKLVGFVTRESFTELPAGVGTTGEIAVYIPMSYQIGGYTVVLPRSAVTPLMWSVEDAMRFAITAGVPPKQMETVIRTKK